MIKILDKINKCCHDNKIKVENKELQKNTSNVINSLVVKKYSSNMEVKGLSLVVSTLVFLISNNIIGPK